MISTNSASILISGSGGFQSTNTSDGSTNTIILNNYSEISDLITLNNSNFYSANSNVTINLDNKYQLGVINSNFQLFEYQKENNYLININNNDIFLRNSNIVNNVINTYRINNDNTHDNNVLIIDNDNCNINFSNYNYNFFINENNEFNINNYHSADTDADAEQNKLFGISTNRVDINCDLYVNKIFTKEIHSSDTDSITITNYSIEQNDFVNTSVGYKDYDESNNSVTPFIINNNNSNYYTSNLFEIKKKFTDESESIFKIDNYGYIYMGNSKYNDKKSYISINNYNNLNFNSELDNYLSFSGDYYSDTFKINKYGNIIIGSNISTNYGILDINRNDNRVNLDINNSNNINLDKPLLNLNIEYETQNNYIWNIENRFIPFFDIFQSKQTNKKDIESNRYNYIDNYKLIFGSNKAQPLKWKKVDSIINIAGLINNTNINNFLTAKYTLDGEINQDIDILEFTQNEWETFEIINLKMTNYILFNDQLFEPSHINLDNNEMHYHYNANKYFFLHGNYINAKTDFDYKKLNLQIINNKNLENSSGGFTDLDNTKTYNILYDYYNLQYNTDQIEYNYKTFNWENNYFSHHIFYPHKIKHDTNYYILNIEDIDQEIAIKKIDNGIVSRVGYKNLFIYPTLDTNSDVYSDTVIKITPTEVLIHDLVNKISNDIDIYSSNFLNIHKGKDDNINIYNDYFDNYTSIRHVEVRATGLKWRRIDVSDTDTDIFDINNLIHEVWDNTTISNLSDYSNLHPYNIEMKNLCNRYDCNNLLQLLQDISDQGTLNITQDEWDLLDIKTLYCNEYIHDSVNTCYYVPDEKIKVLFCIHFPIEYYNDFVTNTSVHDGQYINDYTSNIIQNPDFINLTSNNKSILNINNKGSLIYNDDTYNELSNYSIYAPNRIISTNKIELNDISSQNSSINFNNLYLNNIAGIEFNTQQEFSISTLRVDKISNNNNNLLFDNTQFELNTIIYGLSWKLIDYDIIKNDDTYNIITEPIVFNILFNLIKIPFENIYEINYQNLSNEQKNKLKLITFKSYVIIPNGDGKKYYIQNSNEYNYSSNFLIYDEKNNTNYPELYYNDIISINTNNDNDIKPAITIYGNCPSFNLKSNKINNILYQQSILQKSFKNLIDDIDGIGDENKINDVFQINYFDDNNVLFDNNLYTNNSKHIIEHITGEYNILSFGENYNICIDTKGVVESTFNDTNFGTIWVLDTNTISTNRISLYYERIIVSIFNNTTTVKTDNIITIQYPLFLTVGITDLHENNYVTYDGNNYKPYIQTYSDKLARNSTNKNHKISLGVPHNNYNINTYINDASEGGYLYNYPRYFNEIIKNNDYMLNIYGNTKIYGIDGHTNALSININDTKSIDNTYKVNLGIGIEPSINYTSNTLSINGDIYADNLFYKNNENDTINVTDIYTNAINTFKETLFSQKLNSSFIHTSNINNNFINDNGIFDLKLIPNIPLSIFSIPPKPNKYIFGNTYNIPTITSTRMTGGTNITTHYVMNTDLNFKEGDEVVYTDLLDIQKIDQDNNKYFYFVLKNNYLGNEPKQFNLTANDNIEIDTLIIGGGGGGGYTQSFLNWYEVDSNDIPVSSIGYYNITISNRLKNGIYHFENDEYDNILQGFNSGSGFVAEEFVANNNYIIIDLQNSGSTYVSHKYFKTYNYAGGKGGNYSIINNEIIHSGSSVNIIIGAGGSVGDANNEINSENGTDSSYGNIILYGGKNSMIFNENFDMNPNDAEKIFDLFKIYDDLGFNTMGTRKYFAGDGNNITLEKTIGGGGGGGGGGGDGDAVENSGGGGGFFNSTWGKGANGIAIIRYKFILKNNIVDTVINDNPTTNGLLQYNWIDSNWELNYDAIDVSNILLDVIYDNSNILDNKIQNFSNIINYTSNNIIDYIITSNTIIYDIINNINDTITVNDTNYSNYIETIYDNTTYIDAKKIVSNTIDIERIPQIPFTKFDILDINYIYSPKVNNNIIIDTDFYNYIINYTSGDITEVDNTHYEYIIFKHNSDKGLIQTNYNLQFQIETQIDILIVGGGGGCIGTNIMGGGGGGGFITAVDIDIELNKKYSIVVGSGGNQGDGHDSSAFGLTAHGGKVGISEVYDSAYTIGTGGKGGTCTRNYEYTEVLNHTEYPGGNGGSINTNNGGAIEMAMSGASSLQFINDNNNREYYWGGGGGFGTNSLITDVNDIPDGGHGGGGAGSFNSQTVNIEYSSSGYSYGNPSEVLTKEHSYGLDGSLNSGGGGGGGSESNGGKGGSGIVIIKIKSTIKPSENEKKKAYVSYNFNLDRWEMNSLDLLNLDINIDDIDANILRAKNELIEFIEQRITTNTDGTLIPQNLFTNYNIVDNAIYSHNIFGFGGKSSNLTEIAQETDDGLITIPSEGYTDPENIYYKNLIHGSKFATHSITNNNIANNSITGEKLSGTISGDKIQNASINYNNIQGIINGNVRIINDSTSDELINVSSFNNITLDISLLDLTSANNFAGNTTILSSVDSEQININKFDNIIIYSSNIDFVDTYSGNVYLKSYNNDINISSFENVFVDLSDILNNDQPNFVIGDITITGIIDKNLIENIFIHTSNLDDDTLINTNVYLFGTEKINADYIRHLTLSANQIATHDITKLLDVTLNLNGELLDPSLLKSIEINPSDLDTSIASSLSAKLVTNFNDLLNPQILSNIYIYPSDLSNINDYSVKLSNVTIDTSSEKIHPNLIGLLNITPSDIDNISDYSVKLSNVIITTTDYNKINPNLIASITLTPDQFNNIGTFNSVNLVGLEDGSLESYSINPSLINTGSISINANHIKINDDNGIPYKLPIDLNYNFAENSIDPSLIPSSVTIYGSNIIIDGANKLESVIINGNINSSIIGDNATISSSATIIDTGKIQGEIIIDTQINTGIIKNAVINNGNNIKYTDTKIERTFIYGDIKSSLIGDAEIHINSSTSILGEDTFSGNTTIFGELNAAHINNATINLGANASLAEDSLINGVVTITGIVNAANINSETGVIINLADSGGFNGSNLANESIYSDKLSSNLNIYVNEIKFNNGSSFTSALSENLYTNEQIIDLFVSKQYYTSKLAPSIDVHNMINFYISETDNITLPIYKDIYSNYIITTKQPFNSLEDDKSIIEIASKNNNAYITIVSCYNDDVTKIGIKSSWSDVGESYFKVNSHRLSFVLDSTESVFELSNTSNFCYKPLYIPELIFADGTTMSTAAINMLNSDNQLIMNNTEARFSYTENQVTGDGFIHCNGIHAEFDITAFSSTTKSDFNLKKNINDLQYNNELLQLNPVTFQWKDINKSNSSNVGFIAQDVEKILPNLVKDGLDNYKSVNYISLIPYLVKHIQNLEKRIEYLEKDKST